MLLKFCKLQVKLNSFFLVTVSYLNVHLSSFLFLIKNVHLSS
jgi:hypothetical protein